MNGQHILIWAGVLLITAIIVLLARGPLKRWYRKVRRRKGGVYIWRVDHHINCARRVWGYVGESVSFHFRKQDHLGGGRYGQVAQPWSDLRPVMYRIIPLPWWLCWKWVLRPLETLVMLLTWPVYNDAKNRWNPRRIPKTVARAHRMARDRGMARQVVRTWTAHAVRYALQGAGVACLVAAGAGWLVTR